MDPAVGGVVTLPTTQRTSSSTANVIINANHQSNNNNNNNTHQHQQQHHTPTHSNGNNNSSVSSNSSGSNSSNNSLLIGGNGVNGGNNNSGGGSSSSSNSSSSSSSTSSNSSGYGSTSATPTNSYETHTAATTPVAVAEPIIPIATVAAVSPFYSEAIATQALETTQHYSQQHPQLHLQQQQQQLHQPQQTQEHLHTHPQHQQQQHHQQLQHNLPDNQRQPYYPSYDYTQQQLQQPLQTHHQQHQQLPLQHQRQQHLSSSTYNMGSGSPAYDGAATTNTVPGATYQQSAVAHQYKPTGVAVGVNYDRQLSGRATSSAVPPSNYQQHLPNDCTNPKPIATTQHQQQFLGISGTGSSSASAKSRSSTGTKPQAAATPFYAQPLSHQQQSNNTSSFYDQLKHKMPLDYHDNFANFPNAAAYHQQQKYYAAAKSQLKETASYGSPPGLTGKSLYHNANNFYAGTSTQQHAGGYDKYMYPSLGYEASPETAYRKASATGSLNSSSWPWGIDFASGNSRTIPPPTSTGHLPTATVAPTHASYLAASSSHLARDPYYMSHDKYGMKYDKYTPPYQQAYVSPPSTRHHLWPATHAPLNDRLAPPPSHALHTTSPYFPPNPPTTLNPRQSCCAQPPYQPQSCYYPPGRLAHGQPVAPMAQNASAYMTPQPAAHHQTHLNPLTSSCKYGTVVDYGTGNKLKSPNDLYLNSHYDANNAPPPPPPHLTHPHSYQYGSAAAATAAVVANNQLYSSNQMPHEQQPTRPLGSHDSLANSATYTNDLSLSANTYDTTYLHEPASHLNHPQPLGMSSGPTAANATAYAPSANKRALLDYRKPIQPQPPPVPSVPVPVENFAQHAHSTLNVSASRELYRQSPELLNTPETTTGFNEYDTQSQASGYTPEEKNEALQEKTNKTGDETTKNLSLRDFIANWNDDEDDYGTAGATGYSAEDLSFDQSTVINEVFNSSNVEAQLSLEQTPPPLIPDKVVRIVETPSKKSPMPPKHFVDSTTLSEGEGNQYVNLPDIIIDIEKSNVNSSISMPPDSEPSIYTNALSLDNFDVEKELDQLQQMRKGENDSVIVKPTHHPDEVVNSTKETKSDIKTNIDADLSKSGNPQHHHSPNQRSLSFDDLNLETHKTVQSQRSPAANGIAAANPPSLSEPTFKEMEAYDSGNSHHSNESSLFEKEYETFINKITNNCESVHKPETENVAEFEQNVQDFSKFYKRKRKLKDDAVKSTPSVEEEEQEKKKLKSAEEENVQNSNFPQVYTKKSRNRPSATTQVNRSNSHVQHRRKPLSFYYKIMHTLRRYRLRRTKQVRDYIAELKEKHLPLIKRQSIKNYSIAMSSATERFSPASLKNIVLSVINSEEFRERIMVVEAMEEPTKVEYKHNCPNTSCEACEMIRSLLEPEMDEEEAVALEPTVQAFVGLSSYPLEGSSGVVEEAIENPVYDREISENSGGQLEIKFDMKSSSDAKVENQLEFEDLTIKNVNPTVAVITNPCITDGIEVEQISPSTIIQPESQIPSIQADYQEFPIHPEETHTVLQPLAMTTTVIRKHATEREEDYEPKEKYNVPPNNSALQDEGLSDSKNLIHTVQTSSVIRKVSSRPEQEKKNDSKLTEIDEPHQLFYPETVETISDSLKSSNQLKHLKDPQEMAINDLANSSTKAVLTPNSSLTQESQETLTNPKTIEDPQRFEVNDLANSSTTAVSIPNLKCTTLSLNQESQESLTNLKTIKDIQSETTHPPINLVSTPSTKPTAQATTVIRRHESKPKETSAENKLDSTTITNEPLVQSKKDQPEDVSDSDTDSDSSSSCSSSDSSDDEDKEDSQDSSESESEIENETLKILIKEVEICEQRSEGNKEEALDYNRVSSISENNDNSPQRIRKKSPSFSHKNISETSTVIAKKEEENNAKEILKQKSPNNTKETEKELKVLEANVAKTAVGIKRSLMQAKLVKNVAISCSSSSDESDDDIVLSDTEQTEDRRRRKAGLQLESPKKKPKLVERPESHNVCITKQQLESYSPVHSPQELEATESYHTSAYSHRIPNIPECFHDMDKLFPHSPKRILSDDEDLENLLAGSSVITPREENNRSRTITASDILFPHGPKKVTSDDEDIETPSPISRQQIALPDEDLGQHSSDTIKNKDMEKFSPHSPANEKREQISSSNADNSIFISSAEIPAKENPNVVTTKEEVVNISDSSSSDESEPDDSDNESVVDEAPKILSPTKEVDQIVDITEDSTSEEDGDSDEDDESAPHSPSKLKPLVENSRSSCEMNSEDSESELDNNSPEISTNLRKVSTDFHGKGLINSVIKSVNVTENMENQSEALLSDEEKSPTSIDTDLKNDSQLKEAQSDEETVSSQSHSLKKKGLSESLLGDNEKSPTSIESRQSDVGKKEEQSEPLLSDEEKSPNSIDSPQSDVEKDEKPSEPLLGNEEKSPDSAESLAEKEENQCELMLSVGEKTPTSTDPAVQITNKEIPEEEPKLSTNSLPQAEEEMPEQHITAILGSPLLPEEEPKLSTDSHPQAEEEMPEQHITTILGSPETFSEDLTASKREKEEITIYNTENENETPKGNSDSSISLESKEDGVDTNIPEECVTIKEDQVLSRCKEVDFTSSVSCAESNATDNENIFQKLEVNAVKDNHENSLSSEDGQVKNSEDNESNSHSNEVLSNQYPKEQKEDQIIKITENSKECEALNQTIINYESTSEESDSCSSSSDDEMIDVSKKDDVEKSFSPTRSSNTEECVRSGVETSKLPEEFPKSCQTVETVMVNNDEEIRSDSQQSPTIVEGVSESMEDSESPIESESKTLEKPSPKSPLSQDLLEKVVLPTLALDSVTVLDSPQESVVTCYETPKEELNVQHLTAEHFNKSPEDFMSVSCHVSVEQLDEACTPKDKETYEVLDVNSPLQEIRNKVSAVTEESEELLRDDSAQYHNDNVDEGSKLNASSPQTPNTDKFQEDSEETIESSRPASQTSPLTERAIQMEDDEFMAKSPKESSTSSPIPCSKSPSDELSTTVSPKSPLVGNLIQMAEDELITKSHDESTECSKSSLVLKETHREYEDRPKTPQGLIESPNDISLQSSLIENPIRLDDEQNLEETSEVKESLAKEPSEAWEEDASPQYPPKEESAEMDESSASVSPQSPAITERTLMVTEDDIVKKTECSEELPEDIPPLTPKADIGDEQLVFKLSEILKESCEDLNINLPNEAFIPASVEENLSNTPKTPDCVYSPNSPRSPVKEESAEVKKNSEEFLRNIFVDESDLNPEEKSFSNIPEVALFSPSRPSPLVQEVSPLSPDKSIISTVERLEETSPSSPEIVGPTQLKDEIPIVSNESPNRTSQKSTAFEESATVNESLENPDDLNKESLPKTPPQTAAFEEETCLVDNEPILKSDDVPKETYDSLPTTSQESAGLKKTDHAVEHESKVDLSDTAKDYCESPKTPTLEESVQTKTTITYKSPQTSVLEEENKDAECSTPQSSTVAESIVSHIVESSLDVDKNNLEEHFAQEMAESKEDDCELSNNNSNRSKFEADPASNEISNDSRSYSSHSSFEEEESTQNFEKATVSHPLTRSLNREGSPEMNFWNTKGKFHTLRCYNSLASKSSKSQKTTTVTCGSPRSSDTIQEEKIPETLKNDSGDFKEIPVTTDVTNSLQNFSLEDFKASSPITEDTTNTTIDKTSDDFSTDFLGFKNQSSFDDASEDFHGFEDEHEEERIRREIESLNEDSAANDAFPCATTTTHPSKTSPTDDSDSRSSELNELEALEKELSQHRLLKDLSSNSEELNEEHEPELETEPHLVSVPNVIISTNDIEHIKKMLESDEEPANDEADVGIATPDVESKSEANVFRANVEENIRLSNICRIPKLSDLCRAALNSSLIANSLTSVQSNEDDNVDKEEETNTTHNLFTGTPASISLPSCSAPSIVVERELSVEEALAEMYRQAGVLLSDPEDNSDSDRATLTATSSNEEAQDVLLINLHEILNSDNDVYVLQCDMNVNNDDGNTDNDASADAGGARAGVIPATERGNTVQLIGILNGDSENPEIHIISSDSESEVIILSDCDTDVEFQTPNLPPPRATATKRPSPIPPRDYIPFINDMDTSDDSLSDLSTIHHEEIVPDNLHKFLQEEFYKYLHEKYAQKKLSKYYHANRVLRKYKKKVSNKFRH